MPIKHKIKLALNIPTIPYNHKKQAHPTPAYPTTTMKLSIIALSVISTATAFAPMAPTTTTRLATTTSLNVNPLNIETGKSQLDTAVIDRFNSLPYPTDKILAEYVWVDAKGECRSKTRTLPAARAKAVDTLPRWNFDGSSTGELSKMISDISACMRYCIIEFN